MELRKGKRMKVKVRGEESEGMWEGEEVVGVDEGLELLFGKCREKE